MGIGSFIKKGVKVALSPITAPTEALVDLASGGSPEDVIRGQLAVSTGGLSELLLAEQEKANELAAAEAVKAQELRLKQEALRTVEFDKAKEDQIQAEVLAQRTLAREGEAARLLGQELNRSEGALKRQQDAITRGLAAETRQFEASTGELGRQEAAVGREQESIARGLAAEGREFGEATTEIGRQRDLLGRTEAGIARQGSLAARSGQAQAAAAANLAAQSGFGTSSALQGAAAQAQSTAATSAGDILTGLVATGVEGERLTAREGLLTAAFGDVQAAAGSAQAGLTDRLASLGVQGDLLSAGFADVQAGVADARAGIEDQFGALEGERFKLAKAKQDILFEQERVSDQLAGNLSFLEETFELGGDIIRAGGSLQSQQIASANRQAQRQSLLSGISAGASIGGAVGGPAGVVVGGGVGAVISLFGG